MEDTEITTPNQYKLDTDKIEDLSDVITILEAMDLRMTENHPDFEEFKPYFKKVD